MSESTAPLEILNTLHIENTTVTVRLADDKVCGNGDPNEFEYQLTLQVRGLDKDGFTVEVQTLRDEIENRFDPETSCSGYHVASCEQLANGVLHVVHDLLGDRLESATATVFNRTGYLEATYEKGMAAPRFPRDATYAEVQATEKARKGADYAPSNC